MVSDAFLEKHPQIITETKKQKFTAPHHPPEVWQLKSNQYLHQFSQIPDLVCECKKGVESLKDFIFILKRFSLKWEDLHKKLNSQSVRVDMPC